MRRFGFMVSAAFACLFAGAAAVSTVASRDWVQKKLAEAGITINTATVTKNTNGTVTATSQFACDEVPSLRSVTFTATQASFVTHPVVSDSRQFLMRLLVPTAYADTVGGENSLTVKVLSGFWTDNLGNEHPFDFGADGLNITLDEDMPEVPSDQHTCDQDGLNNCICRWYGKSDAERAAAVPADYNDWTPAEWDGAVGSMDAWVQDESFRESVTKKGTTYWITDLNGTEINLSNVAKSDAWTAALADGLTKINQRMKDCRDAYKRSLTCSNGEEQHQWGLTERKTCGANTWTKKVCSRNGAHKQETGTAQHDFSSSRWGSVNDSDHRRYCACRQESETKPHRKRAGGGEKTYTRNADGEIIGWTSAPDTCADECGWFRPGLVHVCEHYRCGPCVAGDGCNLPCPCGGEHRLGDVGAGRCQRCRCDGCGMTELGVTGERTRGRHTGWQACGRLADADCARSNGVHCECECGDWSHGNDTAHERGSVPERCEQIMPGEKSYEQRDAMHWKFDKSECAYCGDKYGNLDPHVLSEDGGAAVQYAYIDEKSHEKRVKCASGCGYVRNDGPVPHGKDGGALAYENVSAEVCRAWYRCPADGGCGGMWSDDTEAHVRSSAAADGCRCARCGDFQFPHEYAEDACGNRSCAVCGAIDPGTPEQHPTCLEAGEGHACACGRKTGGHIWGAFVEKSSSAAGVVLEASCVASQWGAGGCGAKLEVLVPGAIEACAGDVHVPAASNLVCGCQCGEYGAANPHEDEAFHKWTDGDCFCNCGRWHHAQGDNPCPKVCGTCRDHAAVDGMDPPAVTAENVTEYHEPFGDGDEITHCGCRCGAHGPELDDPAYHYRMPGSCRCYGSGSGGRYHFRLPDPNCPGVCQYRNDYTHKVAGEAKEKASALIPATVDDHAKASATVCACQCGEWGEDGKSITEDCFLHQWPDGSCACHCGERPERPATDDASLHGYSGGSCVCDCNKMHRCPFGNELCPKVCGGTCGGAYRAKDGALALLHAEEEDHETTDEDGACGCKCGKYSAPGPDSPLHQFRPGKCKCECGTVCNPDAGEHVYPSGRCVCQCGEKHRGVPRAGCQGVCALCARAVDDLDGTAENPAPEEKHTRASGACGCACGDFPASAANPNGPLHSQNPSACGCFCGLAPLSEGSHRRASSSVCRCFCGLTAPGGHVKVEGQCACQCGDAVVVHYHAGEGDCWCECGREHKPVTGPCGSVCVACGKRADSSGCEATKEDHTPKTGACGCACGKFGGDAYPADDFPRFHGGSGDPACLCQCGALHRNFSASACPRVCSVCGMDKARENSGADIHTFPDGSCRCICGEHARHRFAYDACDCYCGTTTRAHDYAEKQEKTAEETCQTCGVGIERWTSTFTCTRCGDSYSFDWEIGHASDCGSSGASSSQQTTCTACGCVGCGCSACANKSGYCTTCGRTCGGEGQDGDGDSGGSSSDSQSGDPDGIL